MPKKQLAAAAAVSTEEDLVEKIAQRLLSIRAIELIKAVLR